MIVYSKDKFCSINTWYHGTTKNGAINVLKKVKAKYNKNNTLDFGWGFYLCPQMQWSLNYAKNLIDVVDDDLDIKCNDGYVIEYAFEPLLYTDTYKFKFFDNMDLEFADFVFRNRMYFKYHLFTKCIHNYDYIGGPMSDGKQLDDFNDYQMHRITKGQLFERLLQPKESWQLVLHNQQLCDKLKVTAIYNLKGERVYEIV